MGLIHDAYVARALKGELEYEREQVPMPARIQKALSDFATRFEP